MQDYGSSSNEIKNERHSLVIGVPFLLQAWLNFLHGIQAVVQEDTQQDDGKAFEDLGTGVEG